MKKLVKTAKQQFDERRKELTYRYQYELSETEIYYAYEGVNAYFYILREHNGEYKEIAFGEQYEAFVFSEIFLGTMAEYFRDHNLHIKPLFDWYASADHDCEPFTLMDIWMLDLNKAECVYEDIYEEVSDVRIITAKEQWENDSKDANTLWENKDETLKVLITDEYVKFYRHDDAITCYTFPSLEIMRNDRWFVCKIVDTLSESCEYDKISPFIKWTRTGGDFPLPISIIFNSDYQEYTCHVYEDKELPQEQIIEKKDFSDRFSSLKSDIVANIGELCENGASIDTEALFESYSIVWMDGAVSYFEDVADFSLMKTLEGHWKYGIEYGHDKGKTYDGRLELLTLESLLHILDSLH